jgi:capsular polysaccharide biosynthesis protein
MELTEYLAVLRRQWRIWVGCTVAALVVAAVVLQLTPRTYEASARVFVSASPSISNSAQYVNQRAKSYPGVAESQAVLSPVIDRLGLDMTTSELRARITAENPVDTSQVQITTSGGDPEEAATIANAVAEQTAKVVEEIETPASGNRPVTLTVNDPATVPTQPVAPVALYILGLGLIAGLFVGLAAAVVRSRLDSRIHGEDDVRRIWGTDEDLDLLVRRHGRAGRSALTGRPANALARRLELAADGRPVRIAVLSPSPDESRAARALAEEVAVELRGRQIATVVTGPGLAGSPLMDERPHVRLEVTDPLAPLRFWRDVATRYDGAVLVIPSARVDEAELREVRGILRNAGLMILAVVLTGHRRRPAAPADDAEVAPATAPLPTLPAELRTTSEPGGTTRRMAPGTTTQPGTADAAPATTIRTATDDAPAATPGAGQGEDPTVTARTEVPETKHKGAAVQRRGR